MIQVPSSHVGLEFLEQVLDQPTVERRVKLLRDADLLNASGLSEVLDTATSLIRQDPGKAHQLATLCLEAADRAAAPVVVPRATYLCAQAHASNAEFETALKLIDEAHAGYVALGEDHAALRTMIGRMSVLIELGHYEEALSASQVVLSTLAAGDAGETNVLAGLAYQNCGTCYEQMGRYEDALQAYAAAEHCYRALNMAERIGDIHNNRGIVLLQLGRGNDALAAFEAAAAIFAEHTLTLLHAQALINIGDAHLLLSNYSRSLAVFNQARRLFESLDALAEQHVLLLDTADAYLALNLYPEALLAYREAESLFQTANVPHHRARALWGMGAALSGQGQLEAAEPLLAQAAALFADAQNQPLLCSVMLEQAAVQAAQGDRATAQATAAQALARVSGAAWPVQQVYAHMRIADLLLPDVVGAEPHLLAAQRLSDRLSLPHLRYRLNQRLGHLRLLQGRAEEAQRLLEAAAHEIEQVRGTLAQEVTRISFLRDKLAVYEDLLHLHLRKNDAAATWQAFAVAERAKGRALVDLLMGMPAMRASTLEDPAVATHLEARVGDLNSIYNELLSTGQAGHQQLDKLQTRAVELEREINQLRLQAAGDARASDPLHLHVPLDAMVRDLPSGLLIVAYHVVDEEILAFVVRDGQLQVMRHLSTVAAVQRLVQRLIVQRERLRVGQAFIDRHQAMLEQSAQRVLGALYAELVAPLEPLLDHVAAGSSGTPDAAAPLAVVPHGLLHHVPFHALYDGRQYLLERFAISYAPSVTVLALCQQRQPRTAGTSLVVGVPDPLLPAVAAEAHAVAAQLSDAEMCIDHAATRAMLDAKAPGCAVVHLACHGMFRADNPMFSALKLHDGWLTALDVMQYDLRGALVTLSACESGRSEVMAGDESVGLMRAFLGAGAASLVVSLWLVQDETTAALMAAWYAQLRQGNDRAAALRAAQRAIKADHPHPFYWAPFVLVGQR